MTTLKFKDTDGTWKLIPITGPPGAGVPAGGALGDVLIKQSATDRDTRWGINPPKLHLTDPTAATLAGINTTPLTLGSNTSTNVVGYSTGFQARDSGAIAMLRLNYYGGEVVVGGGDAQPYPRGITSAESVHATARRAAITLGSGWQLLQDFNGNGTKDFTIYQLTNGRSPFSIAADGLLVRFWNNASVDSNGRYDGSNFVASGAIYCSNWLRTYGNTGWYSETFGIGWQPFAGGIVELYGGTGTVLSIPSGRRIRLYSGTDDNHHIRYSNDAASQIDPGSGENANGPWIQGYANITLRCVAATFGGGVKSFFWNGNANIPSASSYAKFSSIEIKEDVEPIDPDESLAQVRQWQPVRYHVKVEQPDRISEGFIAERMYEVSPQVVICTPPGAERPNWPNSIDYGHLTVRLTSAMQAMLARIEQLERKAA